MLSHIVHCLCLLLLYPIPLGAAAGWFHQGTIAQRSSSDNPSGQHFRYVFSNCTLLCICSHSCSAAFHLLLLCCCLPTDLKHAQVTTGGFVLLRPSHLHEGDALSICVAGVVGKRRFQAANGTSSSISFIFCMIDILSKSYPSCPAGYCETKQSQTPLGRLLSSKGFKQARCRWAWTRRPLHAHNQKAYASSSARSGSMAWARWYDATQRRYDVTATETPVTGIGARALHAQVQES